MGESRLPAMSGDLPDYANVTRKDLDEACRTAVEECNARIAVLVAVPAGQRTFANTVLAVEEARAAVEGAITAWGVLEDVAPDDDLRAAASEWAERLENTRSASTLRRTCTAPSAGTRTARRRLR
jgi:thimet oligopeptidase